MTEALQDSVLRLKHIQTASLHSIHSHYPNGAVKP